MIEIWHGEGNDAFCYLNVPDRPAGRPADQLCSWLAARSCRWVRTLFSEMLDRSSRMASLMASSQALVISEWESPTARGTRFDQFKSDRKSTRLNSSHQIISYAVFCLKK